MTQLSPARRSGREQKQSRREPHRQNANYRRVPHSSPEGAIVCRTIILTAQWPGAGSRREMSPATQTFLRRWPNQLSCLVKNINTDISACRAVSRSITGRRCCRRRVRVGRAA